MDTSIETVVWNVKSIEIDAKVDHVNSHTYAMNLHITTDKGTMTLSLWADNLDSLVVRKVD